MIDRNNIIEAAGKAFANNARKNSACMKVGKEYIRAYNWVQMKKECIEYGKRKGTSQEEIDEWSRNVWARDGNFDNWCYLSDLLPTK